MSSNSPSTHVPQSHPRFAVWVAAALFLVMAGPRGLSAQDAGTVAGQVVDAQSGAPVASAQVFIGDLDLGVLTQQNGRFQIENVPAGVHSLEVSRLGYGGLAQDITVGAGETTTLDLRIEQSALQLDEVIVTGTPGGTQRRAIGNSVAQVDAANLTDRAEINSMQDLLTARTPGLQFMRSSGNVGTGSSIQIRGVSSLTLGTQPLIYVDGVRVDNSETAGAPIRGGAQTSALDDFNPNDIASIEVIKGPAAATLYGTEASAGVIQIITKRGEQGAPQFDMSVSQGTNFMIDPGGKMGQQWGISRDTGEPIQFPGGYANVYEYESGVNGNDVLQYGQLQGYDLSVRGGTDAVRYYLSGSYNDSEGVVSYNWNQSLGLRGNVSVILPGNFNLDVSTGYTRGETSYAQQLTQGGIWEMMQWAQPGLAETDRRGFLRYTPEELETVGATREYQRFTGSATVTHDYDGWLSQRLIIGLDHLSEDSEVLVPRHPLGSDGPFGGLSLGDVQIVRPLNTETSLDYSVSANYGVTESLSFTSSFGAQYYSSEVNSINGTGQVFPSPAIRSIEGATSKNIGQQFIQNKSVGFYVQQEANLNDRLFLTAALRADDNSAFGSNFSAQYYPKLSASWVISEEGFWNVDWVNSLRLRSAWGQAGRQPDTFAAVTLYAPANGPGGSPAVTTSTLGNPDVGPEVSTELEIGFEAALLDDRLSAEFTWYDQRVRDALAEVDIVSSRGFSGSQSANLGVLDNWGFEAMLGARIGDTDSWSLDLNLGGAYTMNEIVDLGGLPEETDRRVGFPFPVAISDIVLSAEFDEFGVPVNGMCDGGTGKRGLEPGGEPVPCTADIVRNSSLILGPQFTPWTWTVGTNLGLLDNQLQVFALAEGQYGRWGGDTQAACRHGCYPNTRQGTFLDDPAYVLATVYDTGGLDDNTWTSLFPADIWKLREVGARYQLPSTLIDGLGIQRASISASGRNLWDIWTKVDEIGPGVPIADHELLDPDGSSALGQFPATSSFSMTMRVSF